MTCRTSASKEEEHCIDWIDLEDVRDQVSKSTKLFEVLLFKFKDVSSI